MKEDWRKLCGLQEIQTPRSINYWKAIRKRLKKKRPQPVVIALTTEGGNIKPVVVKNDDDWVGIWHERKKVDAIIKGKQFMFHSKYQFVRLKGRPFTWSQFSRAR